MWLLPTSYLTFGSVYMSMPLSHFVPAYPCPSLCPQVHSLRLCLYSCPTPRFMEPIFFLKEGNFFFLINLINLINFIFGCIESLLLRAGFSLVVVSRGDSSLRCAGFSLRWLLLLQSTSARHAGFSSCVTRAQ